MNFELTDEQKDIIKAAREFAEKEFPDIAQECDREEKTRSPWKKMRSRFLGVSSRSYGGRMGSNTA
jgi:alkylation response protein AidB-like acyl-CoA dehydrogenase